ncbi:hypothetical protein GCM10009836_46710 [Pseudonocardia ailaonensis]|uniref:N-acetyltransferase domain-containing protein n=1 Tax=Pseudonocardia ailaonensis TaxID=367279 RepID=A0ABN2NDD1_9PSEU
MLLDGARTVVGRVQRARETHGVSGVVRTAGARVRQWAHRIEEHHWWEAVLADVPQARPMPEGMTAGRLPREDIDKAASLPMVNFAAAGERYAAGGHNWVALDETDRAAFGTWAFPGKVPLRVGHRGWATLPADVVGVEDGATTPAARRTNVAIAVLGVMADTYTAEGMRSLVAKTAVGNRPVYMLLSRAGYRRVGLMRSVWIGPLRFATFTDVEGPVGAALEAELGGGLPGKARRTAARLAGSLRQRTGRAG